MLGSLLPWIIAALGVVVGVLSWLKLRSTEANLQASHSEATSLEEKLRAAEKRFESRNAGQRRRDDELVELRRKLEKARKRASQAREEQLAESHRIKELEERLRLREADVRATRLAASHSVAVAPSPVVPKPPAPKRVVKESVVKEPAVEEGAEVPKATPVAKSEALSAAERRAEQAETERDAGRLKLAELSVQVKRLQGKARTQDKLYASMRLELEAKKDRLGAQQEELERLRALKVALMESPAEVTPARAEDATQGSAAAALPSAE